VAIPFLPKPAPVTSPSPYDPGYHPPPWHPIAVLPLVPTGFEWLEARLREMYNQVNKEVNGNRYIILEDLESSKRRSKSWTQR
jgi:hypothetical protein